jgi:hypothetical protein
MFILAHRAPQRAAIPLQKMRTSKVGAAPWRGRDPSHDPGILTVIGHLSCLSPELGLVALYTVGEGLA